MASHRLGLGNGSWVMRWNTVCVVSIGSFSSRQQVLLGVISCHGASGDWDIDIGILEIGRWKSWFIYLHLARFHTTSLMSSLHMRLQSRLLKSLDSNQIVSRLLPPATPVRVLLCLGCKASLKAVGSIAVMAAGACQQWICVGCFLVCYCNEWYCDTDNHFVWFHWNMTIYVPNCLERGSPLIDCTPHVFNCWIGYRMSAQLHLGR